MADDGYDDAMPENYRQMREAGEDVSSLFGAAPEKTSTEPEEAEVTEPADEAPEASESAEEAQEATSDEEADAGDDATESEDEEAGEETPKPRSSAQKRIDQMRWQLGEAQRENEALRRQLQNGAPAAQPGQPQPQSQTGDAEPKLEDFGSEREYMAAWAKHAFRQEQQAHERQQAETRQQQQAQERIGRYRDGLADAVQKHPDYEEVVHSPAVRYSDTVAQAVFESDNAHDLAYHLASNPEELARINALPPPAAVFKLGQLSAKLSQPAPQPPKKQPKAPPPPKTVKPAGSAPVPTVEQLAESGDMLAYRRAREKQDAGRH